MLVLSRKADEKIVIGQNITVTVLRVQGRIVKIGVEAPDSVPVFRSELVGKPSPREPGTPGAAPETSDGESSASGDSSAKPTVQNSRAPRDRIAPGGSLHRRAGPAPSAALGQETACFSFAS